MVGRIVGVTTETAHIVAATDFAVAGVVGHASRVRLVDTGLMRWLRRWRSDIGLRLFWIRSMIAYRRPAASMWRFATAPISTIPTIDEILPKVCAEMETTYEQGAAILDLSARRLFGISGEEWMRRYDAGGFADADHMKVVSMEMLIPFARPSVSGRL